MKTFQETLSQMNELAASSMKQFSEINFGMYDNIVKSQTELANICVRNGLKQMDMVRDVRDVTSYAKAQKELASETVTEMVNFTQSSVEMATKSRDDLFGWIESTTEAATRLNPIADAKAA